MKYLLVIQFPEEFYGDLDWIAEIEDKLEERLAGSEVDGHDIGSGEVNIFVYTNHPGKTFEVVKDILDEEEAALETVKAAYRGTNDSQYICLWPKELREFKIT